MRLIFSDHVLSDYLKMLSQPKHVRRYTTLWNLVSCTSGYVMHSWLITQYAGKLRQHRALFKFCALCLRVMVRAGQTQRRTDGQDKQEPTTRSIH